MADSGNTSSFDNDPRAPCKYGQQCYQKNKNHHEKYKHPLTVSKEEEESLEQPLKKHKPNLFEKKNSTSLTRHEKPSSISPPTKNLLNVNKNENEKGLKPLKNNKPMLFEKRQSVSPSKRQLSNSSTPSKETVNKNSEEKRHVLLKDKIRTSDSKKLELKSNPQDLIKQLFLVIMPEDFFSFWEMCESLSKDDPSNALKSVKLKLVGPFDVLAGKVPEVFEDDLPDFLRHWRYYYDPPEFQTVLACEDSRCLHIGYFRDDPKEMPVFVASNALDTKNPGKNGEIKVEGQNLFVALNAYLEELKTDPFSRMKIPKFQKVLNAWAKDKGISLEKTSKEMELRNRKRVAKTFHGAGIVVPVDKKNDVGYRELAASNVMIKKILNGIVESKTEDERTKFWEQMQPVITFANIANDECDFGTSLELGLDLFSFGSALLHRSAKQLLMTAYTLLGREEFSKIIEAHLECRRKGRDLSIL